MTALIIFSGRNGYWKVPRLKRSESSVSKCFLPWKCPPWLHVSKSPTILTSLLSTDQLMQGLDVFASENQWCLWDPSKDGRAHSVYAVVNTLLIASAVSKGYVLKAILASGAWKCLSWKTHPTIPELHWWNIEPVVGRMVKVCEG